VERGENVWITTGVGPAPFPANFARLIHRFETAIVALSSGKRLTILITPSKTESTEFQHGFVNTLDWNKMPSYSDHDNMDIDNLGFKTTEQPPVSANCVRSYYPLYKFPTM